MLLTAREENPKNIFSSPLQILLCMLHGLFKCYDAGDSIEDRVNPKFIESFTALAFCTGDRNDRDVPDLLCAGGNANRDFSECGLGVDPAFSGDDKVCEFHVLIEICEIQDEINPGTDRNRKIRDNSAEKAAGSTAAIGFRCAAFQLIF